MANLTYRNAYIQENLEPDRTICTHTLGGIYPGIFSGRYDKEFSFSHMLLEVFMTVIITRFLHYILKPFKQPRITSEILGGLIMGPSVLGRSSKFASYVFPSNSEYVLKTFGLLGFMYFLFICGVQTDLGTVERATKKHWSIALFGVIVPIITTTAVAIIYRDDLSEELRKGASIWGVASSLSITAFPVIYTIIKDFNLMSSDIGRMAMLTSVISDVVGINGVIAFEAAKQGEKKPIAALWYMISLVTVVATLLVGMRHVCLWIIRTTPQGKPVDQFYIVAILLGVMVAGFISDFLGLAVLNGPLWLGLAIPDGPPLGSTLVDKSETFLLEILLPFSYIYVGLYTDVFSMSGRWPELKPLFYMALCAYVTKLISTLVVTRFFFNMTVRDSFTVSFIMSLRGQVELILFIHWVDLKMITQPYFTMMVLLSTTVTAVISPLITIIYDPTRPYAVNKRRNIQHNPPNADVNIVVTIQDEESVPGLISLLEISNPCQSSPLSVSALRLIELVGRASPIFVDHENQHHSLSYTSNNPIHNAFKIHHESRSGSINVHPFTSVSPKTSMYQDICELALLKKASVIILPYDKDTLHSKIGIEGAEIGQKKSKTMNENVLNHAPCSVGVFVDKGFSLNYNIQTSTAHVEPVRHHFAVLFLGGPDSREALAYADRMANHPTVWLTVVRFLAYKGTGDDLMEKKLDDGLVTWFWVKNEGNSRVIYREVVVRNGEETMAAIQGMNDYYYDLWIVGRKHGINPVLCSGLTSWSDNDELGVIGEYVASMDLGTTASVLVIQQQVLRGQ